MKMTITDSNENYEKFDFTFQVTKLEELMGSQLVGHIDNSLTKIQIGILRTIADHQPMTMSQLSEIVNMNYGNTSTQCKKLENNGYIIRKRNEEDERYVNLYITQQGQAVIDKIQAWLNDFVNQVSQEFSSSEWEEMLESLKLFEQLVQKSIQIIERKNI